MHLEINSQLRERSIGATLGVVTITHTCVTKYNERLWKQIEGLCQHISREYKLENLSQHLQIAAVRELQKAFGFDPTRYRPSSEALLRRILKGQGLHQINTAVDVNNLCSLEFLCPMSIYDLSNVEGQIQVRLGLPGEQYPGIGRQFFQVAGKVILADEQGVIGNTVSDSERTKVTTATTDILMVISAPFSLDLCVVKNYVELAAQRIVEFNGGRVGDIQELII
jgi:DNA/RNA-binding domain of Phe-tRNA-synthetase-like protein